MAFEADCGVSTVLEEIRVTSTARFLVPGECRATGPRDEALRDSATPTGASSRGFTFGVANPKSEISKEVDGRKLRIEN